jgi:hypothetical protein
LTLPVFPSEDGRVHVYYENVMATEAEYSRIAGEEMLHVRREAGGAVHATRLASFLQTNGFER